MSNKIRHNLHVIFLCEVADAFTCCEAKNYVFLGELSFGKSRLTHRCGTLGSRNAFSVCRGNVLFLNLSLRSKRFRGVGEQRKTPRKRLLRRLLERLFLSFTCDNVCVVLATMASTVPPEKKWRLRTYVR